MGRGREEKKWKERKGSWGGAEGRTKRQTGGGNGKINKKGNSGTV